MGFRYLLAALTVLSLYVPQTMAATDPSKDAKDDIYAVPKLVAVQNRAYNLNKNASILLGYMPSDAFTKGLTVGGSYTYYFTDFTAWEILNAQYVFNLDTGLKKDLIDYFAAQPDSDRVLDFPQYYLTTNIVYTPIYNKNLFFNKSIVHGEISFVVGGGAAKLKQAGILPMVDGGVILKYFMSQTSSIRIDARELVYIDDVRGVQGLLDLKLGVDFAIGDTPRTVE